jgi:hypothetical protein
MYNDHGCSSWRGVCDIYGTINSVGMEVSKMTEEIFEVDWEEIHTMDTYVTWIAATGIGLLLLWVLMFKY